MAIKRPAMYEHNNPNLPFVNIDNVLGGLFIMSGATEQERFNIPVNKLKDKQLVKDTNGELWVLVDINNHDNINGWRLYATPSGLTGDTYVSATTFDNSTFLLTIHRNDGVNLTENLSMLSSDVYVLSGIYNPSGGTVTYTNSTGGTFIVSGFTTGMTDTFVTGGTINSTDELILNLNDNSTTSPINLNNYKSYWTAGTGSKSAKLVSQISNSVSGDNSIVVGYNNHVNGVNSAIIAGSGLTLSTDNTLMSKNAYVDGTFEVKDYIHFVDGGAGDYNTYIGYKSANGSILSTGYQNTSIGDLAMFSATTAFQNTAIGNRAFSGLTTGKNNTAIGEGAGMEISTGNSNTFIGRKAGWKCSGSFNTFIGKESGLSNTMGTHNNAQGTNALRNATGGTFNVAIGNNSLKLITEPNYNTIVGGRSFGNTTGQCDRNTSIGFYNGTDVSNLTDTVLIGYMVGRTHATSHRLMIDVTDTNTPLIDGDFIGRTLTLNGSLNISTVPTGTSVNNLGIDINGNVIVDTTGGTVPTDYQSINRITPAVINSGLTLDFNSKNLLRATKSGGGAIEITGTTTISYSSITNMESGWLPIEIISSPQILKFDSTHKSSDYRWDSVSKELSLDVGFYQLSITNNGSYKSITCTQAEI